jgi:hypothetical protein
VGPGFSGEQRQGMPVVRKIRDRLAQSSVQHRPSLGQRLQPNVQLAIIGWLRS